MTRLRLWLGGGLAGTAFAFVIYAVGLILSYHSRPWLVAVVGFSAGLLVFAVGELWSAADGEPPGGIGVGGLLGSDRQGGGLRFVERLLERATQDRDRAAQLRERLAVVAVHRLRHEHGVDPDLDPDRARALVDDAVWTLITNIAPEPVRRARIEQWVRGTEEL